MECKICHNTLNNDCERCQYCGAKVVKSNYGNGQVVTNAIGEVKVPIVNQTLEAIPIINPVMQPQTNGETNQTTPVNNVNNNLNSNVSNSQNNINPVNQQYVSSTRVESNPSIQVQPTIEGSNMSQISRSDNQIIEEELAEHYLGEKYQIFKKKKFSFATFFFGGFYMCYRKQYVNAVVLFASSIAATKIYDITNSIIVFIVLLIIYIFYSITFPKTYLSTVNKKIKKDIELFQGSNYSILKKQLLRESSTSALAMGISILVIFVIGIVMIIAMAVKGIGEFFKDAEYQPDSSEVTDNNSNNNNDNSTQNENVIGTKNHGYIKTNEKFTKQNQIESNILTYESIDGTIKVEFEISNSTSAEEVESTKYNSLQGNTISFPDNGGWIITNSDGNINSSILVKKMKDGKVHIITVSTDTNQQDCFDMLDTYYM